MDHKNGPQLLFICSLFGGVPGYGDILRTVDRIWSATRDSMITLLHDDALLQNAYPMLSGLASVAGLAGLAELSELTELAALETWPWAGGTSSPKNPKTKFQKTYTNICLSSEVLQFHFEIIEHCYFC